MNDLMDDESFEAQVLLCEACGRGFTQMNAFSNHISSCRQQKKRMASALGEAKEKYRNKKARLEASTQPDPEELDQPESMPAAAIDVRNSNFVPIFRALNHYTLYRSRPLLRSSTMRPRFRNHFPSLSVDHDARTAGLLCVTGLSKLRL